MTCSIIFFSGKGSWNQKFENYWSKFSLLHNWRWTGRIPQSISIPSWQAIFANIGFSICPPYFSLSNKIPPILPGISEVSPYPRRPSWVPLRCLSHRPWLSLLLCLYLVICSLVVQYYMSYHTNLIVKSLRIDTLVSNLYFSISSTWIHICIIKFRRDHPIDCMHQNRS